MEEKTITLEEYVNLYPGCQKQLRFENNDTRTAYIVNAAGVKLAEIWISDIRKGIENDSEIAPGVKYSDLAENSRCYEEANPLQPESVYVEYGRMVKAWIKENKKRVCIGLGTFAGIMFLYISCSIINLYSEPEYNEIPKPGAVEATFGDRIQKDIRDLKFILSPDAPVKLNKAGYKKLLDSYNKKVADYKKSGAPAKNCGELEELVKKLAKKAQ